MKIVVIGASGALGSRVADLLDARGDDVVWASRGTGVDAYTGEGLAEAVAGADAVVDCLGVETMKADDAIDFFGTTAGNIGRAATDAGVAHVVVVSIVNAGDPQVNGKFGYYQGKAAQEVAYRKVVEPASLTIVASTQWFELAETMMGAMAFGPVSVVPRLWCRPAAVADVAAAVADVVSGQPATDGVRGERTVEVAGPVAMSLVDVAKAVAKRQGSPRWVFGVSFGGPAIRNGGLLPADPDVVTPTTLDEWLARRADAHAGGAR